MQELKQMRIWLCWKYRVVKGKKTKVPVSAKGGPTGTDRKYQSTWVTYEEARRAASAMHCNGIGFVLPDGYFLLDIDHRSADDPLTRELLEQFSTYTETSVSGQGIHIIGKCDLDKIPVVTDKDGRRRLSGEFYQKNPGLQVELYIGGLTNRYATYSGKGMKDNPVQDCTEAVLTTLDTKMRRYLPAEKPAPSVQMSPEPEPQTMTAEELRAEADDVILALSMQKNGKKFIRLFRDGDTSGYGSQSEAEIALCTLIAYRAGNNPSLIDAVFRQSRLYREKWERKDYRDATIRKAIQFCNGVFHPSRTDHPYFIVFNKQGTPVLEPSLLADYIRREITYIIVRDSNTQGRMVYLYDQGCYRRCDRESFLSVIKKPVMDYSPLCVKMPRITETYNQLMTDPVTASQDDLNADESVINFRNGLLYITPDGYELREHSPAVLSTVQIPCDWPGRPVPTPVFDQFMKDLSGGDRGIEQLLLEIAGVVISNIKGWHMKKALFLVGPGDTGKSVFKTVLEKILGKENFAAVDLKDLETRFTTGRMYGKRLVGCSDISFARVNEMKMFKTITGGDSIFGEFKGEQGFTFVYNGFLIFGMNRLPMFGGDDGRHVYDRFIIVRCRNVIPKEKQDKLLIDRLLAETEGICYKFVRALQTVLANGLNFTEPESVIAERDEYVKENNSVIAFFSECMCRKEDDIKASHRNISTIYAAYRNYCRQNGIEHHKTMNEFRKRIAEHKGVTVSDLLCHNEKGTCFRDYDLTEEAIREYGSMFSG
jgi:P4 family phage/plasmid primase-like protien